VAVAVVAAIPIGLQWNENRHLKRELSIVNGETTVVGAAKSERRRGGNEKSPGVAGKSQGVQPSGPADPSAHTGSMDWQRALSEQDPVRRLQLVSALLANLDPNSPPRIAELFFGEGVEGNLETEAGFFLRAWAQMDGAAAIAFLEGKNQAKSANSSMLAALGGWASKNPEAARGWVEAVENGNLREDLLFGVIDGWSLVDFNAAADYAETRRRSGARTRFIDLLFKRSLAAGGIAAAQIWFEGIFHDDHNKNYRRRAFERIAATMSRHDAPAAALWIASHASEIPMSRETVEGTAKRLAETSPEGALQWISSLPALGEGVVAGSLGRVFSDWAEKNSEAAGKWLSANENHPNYATMARNYSAKLADLDTAEALGWARSIGDDGQRQAAVVGVAERRIKADGDAAIEELRLAGLTEEEISQARQAAQAKPQRGIRLSGGGNGQLQFFFENK